MPDVVDITDVQQIDGDRDPRRSTFGIGSRARTVERGAFRQFLSDYPNGRYAHIAQYWLAEANYAQRNFKDAIGDYRGLISRFPNSPKLAEALLKIGYSQYELAEYKQSSETLKGLLKRYPGTTEAGQAQNLLKKIRLKQGR